MSDTIGQGNLLDDADKLRELARDKGLIAERALRANLWRLIKADGSPMLNPANTDTGFSYLEAVELLEARPDEFA